MIDITSNDYVIFHIFLRIYNKVNDMMNGMLISAITSYDLLDELFHWGHYFYPAFNYYSMN